jgi:tetratricopeptide (TPR) repeat protein
MDPGRWELVKEAFDKVAGLPEEQRAQALKQIPDPEVRSEVLRLVSLHENNTGRLERLQPVPDLVRGAAALHSLLPGQLATGRFRILRFIAAGGMGEVYEAYDIRLDERVALKVLRAESSGREAAIARFKKELQNARRVSHPNVCRVHDSWQLTTAGGRVVDFFTMEFLEGETLAARLAKGPVPEEETRAIARQLVAGLAAAHAAGVIHRDLKPGNIILVPGGRAMITDFGLSRPAVSSGHSTVEAIGAGTPAYMSPEQIEGAAAGPAADIYSLGVVLYEMLTGRLPLDAPTPMALAVRKLRDTPPPPSELAPHIGPAWDGVIRRCLAHSPAERFASVEEVGRALAGKPVRAAPSARKLRWRTIGAIAAALAAPALGWFVWMRPNANPEALRRYQEGISAYRDGATLRANKLFDLATRLDPQFAPARAKLAETWADLDYSDRANQDIVVATDLARAKRLRSADAAQVAAARATVLRDYPKAIEAYRQLASNSNDSGAWVDLGRAQERTDPAGAQASYEKALTLNASNAAALLRLGVLAGRSQKIDAALQRFAEAEKSYQATSDYEGQVELELHRGRALIANNRVSQGEPEIRRALDRARANGNLAQQVQSLSQLAVAAVLTGDQAQSQRYASEAQRLASANGLESLAANIFIDLGNTYLTQYQLKEAETHFEQALEMAKRYKHTGLQAMASLSLASLAVRRQQPDLALSYARPAVEHYAATGYRRNRSLGQALIVQALLQLQKFSEAKSVIDAELGDETLRADATSHAQWLETRADLASQQGRLNESLAGYRAARALRKQSGRKPAEAYAAMNEADLLSQLGRAAEADTLLEEWQPAVAKLDPGVRSRWYLVSARAALRQGERKAAEANARAGMAVPGGKSAARDAQFSSILCAAVSRPCPPPGPAHDIESRIHTAMGLLNAGNSAAARGTLEAVVKETHGINPEAEYRAFRWLGRPAGGPEQELRSVLGEQSFSQYRLRTDLAVK